MVDVSVQCALHILISQLNLILLRAIKETTCHQAFIASDLSLLTLLTLDSIGKQTVELNISLVVNFRTSFWVTHAVSPADCAQFLHITATPSRRTSTFSPGYPKTTFPNTLMNIYWHTTHSWSMTMDPMLLILLSCRGFMIWSTRAIWCQHWSSFDEWWSLMIMLLVIACRCLQTLFEPPWQWFYSYWILLLESPSQRQGRFIRFSIVQVGWVGSRASIHTVER